MSKHKSFENLYSIIKKLRTPGSGCPWDLEQTPETLKDNLIEEVYECIDAIDENDNEHIKEELGDILLLIMMISYIKEQENKFSIKDVLNVVSEKLIRRHPHVFSDIRLNNSDEVIKQWDDIKINIEGRSKENTLLNGIPKSLPPLEKAYNIQKKASKVGFDWKNVADIWDKVEEELLELKQACLNYSHKEIINEYGDFLFSIINTCRFLNINPSLALNKTNNKFLSRFKYVENSMKKINKEMVEDNFELMDEFWEKAKKENL